MKGQDYFRRRRLITKGGEIRNDRPTIGLMKELNDLKCQLTEYSVIGYLLLIKWFQPLVIDFPWSVKGFSRQPYASIPKNHPPGWREEGGGGRLILAGRIQIKGIIIKYLSCETVVGSQRCDEATQRQMKNAIYSNVSPANTQNDLKYSLAERILTQDPGI